MPRNRYWQHSQVMATNKLLNQLVILDKRIETALQQQRTQLEQHEGAISPLMSNLLSDELELDLETYYTVAADVLKAAAPLLHTLTRKKLANDVRYKQLQKVRNWIVRHAYDKPDGHSHGLSCLTADRGA